MWLVELDNLAEPLLGGAGGRRARVVWWHRRDLLWRDKTHNIGVRADDGRLVAAAGVVLAEVMIEREPSFEVAGLGGLIVTRSERGRGLARMLCQAWSSLRANLRCGERCSSAYRS
jgi:predicted N-acetyltransferase YhbS